MSDTVIGELQWEDEGGNLIEAFAGSFNASSAIQSLAQSSVALTHDTRCLQFIDPYGDTTFNQLQIPKLIEELEALSLNCQTDEQRRKLEAVIEFVRKAKGETHTYIKFYGD
jgi:hypothetical protein